MSYYNWSNSLEMPHTLQVIARCWLEAEANLREDVSNNSPGIGEEAITQSFHRQLTVALRDASNKGYIEQAFFSDLQEAFPELVHAPELTRIAQGLVADVTLHKRDTERATGGDFGLMIVRPQVIQSFSKLSISDYCRGLLCQAKLKAANGKWGTFSPNQHNILLQRLDYLGLLLYSYQDRARRNLRPFQWQLCKGFSFDQVTAWAKGNKFPSPVNSGSIITALGNAKIGTDDQQILNDFVSPAGNSSLTIVIWWPPGQDPGSEVYVYTSQQVTQKAQITIRR